MSSFYAYDTRFNLADSTIQSLLSSLTNQWSGTRLTNWIWRDENLKYNSSRIQTQTNATTKNRAYLQKRAVLMEPDEKKALTLMQQI